MTSTHADVAPRIVVGVDGSAGSKRALRWAAGIAATTGAHIQAISAWNYPASYGWTIGVPDPNDWNPAVETQKMLIAAVDEVFGPDRPANLELMVSEGRPAGVLLGAAKGALMLVVGSRGHGGFASLLLGAVSAAVAEHASCPVLVMHGADEWPGARS